MIEIENIGIFTGIKCMPWMSAKVFGKVEIISETVLDSFIKVVKNQNVLFGEKNDRNVAFAYSPLNGTGLFQ